MPDDLFYPVGVVTCIMIFEANKSNKNRKTWFGYFKDDGFEKRKHLGRIDVKNRYLALKERLLSAMMKIVITLLLQKLLMKHIWLMYVI